MTLKEFIKKQKMDEKDKQIIKGSMLVVADQIVSTIPCLNIAWGLAKSLCGAGLKLRESRVLEWVEMIRDHHDIFIRELLEQEDFQDGFVIAIEKYITERDKFKREYFRNIFIGFALEPYKSGFPLEKFIHTLSQLTYFDIVVLKEINFSNKNLHEGFQVYGNDDKFLKHIYNLIDLGILRIDLSSRLGHIKAPFVLTSEFGERFALYTQPNYKTENKNPYNKKSPKNYLEF